MADFRPIPESDRDEVRWILRYAFSPERGPPDDDPEADRSALFDRWGLYDGGELVSVCKLYRLDARVRGAVTTIGGLGAVATPPEHRRRGYVRELCRRALTEYRGDDVPLVALWPFSTPFYRRLGWATANKYATYDLPPEALPDHARRGRFRRLDADDWRRLRRVETAHGEGTSLSLRRSERWWRERTLAGWPGDTPPYCYGYEHDGELRGYVIYTVADDATRTLSVDDLAYADEEAYRALLDFLGTHGAQVQRVELGGPPDAELLDRVEDPAAVECTIETGPMVRLTDVAGLERIDWPADGELDCTLSVSDPLLDRNDGLFRLSASGGTARVEPLSDGDRREQAEVTVDVATLSQLAVGAHGVDAAERLSTFEITDESIREPLRDVFRTRPVRLREFF